LSWALSLTTKSIGGFKKTSPSFTVKVLVWSSLRMIKVRVKESTAATGGAIGRNKASDKANQSMVSQPD
jgi:hypothetical protein